MVVQKSSNNYQPTLEEPMNNDNLNMAPPQELTKQYLKRFSTVIKMAMIAILVLLLLIPLSMVRSVLRERLDRRDAAVKEITSTFGSEQVVMGPALIIDDSATTLISPNYRVEIDCYHNIVVEKV